MSRPVQNKATISDRIRLLDSGAQVLFLSHHSRQRLRHKDTKNTKIRQVLACVNLRALVSLLKISFRYLFNADPSGSPLEPHQLGGAIRSGSQFLLRGAHKRRTNNESDMECGDLSPHSKRAVIVHLHQTKAEPEVTPTNCTPHPWLPGDIETGIMQRYHYSAAAIDPRLVLFICNVAR